MNFDGMSDAQIRDLIGEANHELRLRGERRDAPAMILHARILRHFGLPDKWDQLSDNCKDMLRRAADALEKYIHTRDAAEAQKGGAP